MPRRHGISGPMPINSSNAPSSGPATCLKYGGPTLTFWSASASATSG